MPHPTSTHKFFNGSVRGWGGLACANIKNFGEKVPLQKAQ
jgi:hypothetical protein